MMPAKRPIFAVALCGLIVVSSCLCVFSEEITTYGEWCNKLNELHRELEEIEEPSFWYLAGPTIIGTILCAAFGVGSVNQELFHNNFGLAIDLALLSVLSGSIGVTVTVLRAIQFPEMRTIREKIGPLTQAGANRMWFYPCSPSG